MRPSELPPAGPLHEFVHTDLSQPSTCSCSCLHRPKCPLVLGSPHCLSPFHAFAWAVPPGEGTRELPSLPARQTTQAPSATVKGPNSHLTISPCVHKSIFSPLFLCSFFRDQPLPFQSLVSIRGLLLVNLGCTCFPVLLSLGWVVVFIIKNPHCDFCL